MTRPPRRAPPARSTRCSARSGSCWSPATASNAPSRSGCSTSCAAFFAMPAEYKEAIAIGRSPCHRGYVGIATETLDDANTLAGDLKETIDSGPEHGPDHPEVIAGTPLHGPNQLPTCPASAPPGRSTSTGGRGGRTGPARRRHGPRAAGRLPPRSPRRDDLPLPDDPLPAAAPAPTGRGSARMRHAHRLRQRHAAHRRRRRRPAGDAPRRHVDRRRGPRRPRRRQPRRPDGDLDQRPLRVQPAPGHQPARRRPLLDAAVRDAAVPRPHRMPGDVPGAGRGRRATSRWWPARTCCRGSTTRTATATRSSTNTTGPWPTPFAETAAVAATSATACGCAWRRTAAHRASGRRARRCARASPTRIRRCWPSE